MKQLETPNFASEAEEARWWFENQDVIADAFAEEEGMEFVRVEKEDAALLLSRAKALGLSPEAYVKQLLHPAPHDEAA